MDPVSNAFLSLVSQDGDYFSLVVRTEFHVMDASVEGYVTLVLGSESLAEMLRAIEEDL